MVVRNVTNDISIQYFTHYLATHTPLIRPLPPKATPLIRPLPPKDTLLIRPLPPKTTPLIRTEFRSSEIV